MSYTLVIAMIKFWLFAIFYFFFTTIAPFLLFFSLAADASVEVLGGPASPLAVQVSDVNKNYVFLTWQPPSADGSSLVEGYYVEK